MKNDKGNERNLFNIKLMTEHNLFNPNVLNNITISLLDNSGTIFRRSYATILGHEYVVSLSKFERIICKMFRSKTYIVSCKPTSNLHCNLMLTVAHHKEMKEFHEHQKRNKYGKR